MKSSILTAAMLLFCVPQCQAQGSFRPFELYGGYSGWISSHQGIPANFFNGWESSLAFKLKPSVGIAADFSGHYGSFDLLVGPTFESATNVPYRIKSHAFLFGPRLYFRSDKGIVPFAHAMLGLVRVDRTSTIGGDYKPAYDFGMALGGGIDLNLRPALAVRIFQADYMLVGGSIFPIERSNFRFSTGVVLKSR